MIRKLFTLCLFGLATGCGAADDSIEPTDDSGELGAVEQAMSAAHPGYGVTTGATHTACNDTSTGQACLLPRVHNYVWCAVDSGFSSGELNDIREGFRRANTVGGGSPFTFTELTGVAQCTQVVPAPHILVRKGTCSGGSTSGTMEAFVCPTFQPVFAVTESVPGSYQSFGGGVITVDTADVNAQPAGPATAFTTAAQEQSCLRIGGIAQNAMLFSGIGATTASTSNDPFTTLYTARQLRSPSPFSGNPPTGICLSGNSPGLGIPAPAKRTNLSTQQLCKMSHWTDTTPGSFAFTTGNCP